MVSTRSSQGSTQSSPASVTKKSNKRAAEPSSAPAAKRGKTSKAPKKPKATKQGGNEKKQKTITDTIGAVDGIEDSEDAEMQAHGVGDVKENRDAGIDERKESEIKKREDSVKERKEVITRKGESSAANEKVGQNDVENLKGQQNGSSDRDPKDKSAQDNGDQQSGVINREKNAFDEVKADIGEVRKAAEQEQDDKSAKINDNNESIIDDKQREATIPSSILEKGVIHFFFRGRVGVEDPQGIEDVARSYIVLRPLPRGAKLGEGPLEDTGNARLFALPKKTLPKSKRDRFLVFVEKGKASIKDLRDQFAGNEHATKTSGTSHTPAATPFAEGIYAITTTGQNSHLAYHITVPSPIGEIQRGLGLNEKGSYVVSVKNPEAPTPANVSIGNPAKYPAQIQGKFRGRRWMPLEPEVLEYEGTQFLIIGEGLGNLGKAMEARDEGDEKEKPSEELEKLEEEDHDRVEHLKEDDPIFADLGLSSKEYPKMQTTW